MNTTRCAKWNKEAQEFFDQAQDGSLELHVVISHSCASQWNEGFEELVNALNCEAIKRKIKKITITDTTYLYRHTNPEFEKYIDKLLPTPWYQSNAHIIKELQTQYELKSWVEGLDSLDFKKWYKQIKRDFSGDENGNDLVQDFRDVVLKEAAVNSYKNKCTENSCINFILEECSYTAAYFQNTFLVYPKKSPPPLLNLNKRYEMNILDLPYQISYQSIRANNRVEIDPDLLDKEVVRFMKEKVSDVNFFVIDKYGHYIYKNEACERNSGNSNPSNEGAAWRNTLKVINEKKQIIIEERSNSKRDYLSIKSPLEIDGEAKGVIGLSIDITDRKRAEALEIENKIHQVRIEEQEKRHEVFKQVAHDIQSPLLALQMLPEVCKNLQESEYKILKSVIDSIQKIAGRMLDIEEDSSDAKEEENTDSIAVCLAIEEVLRQKGYQYKDKPIELKLDCDVAHNEAFIRGNYSTFTRMLSNLINNAVEAFEGKPGAVELSVSKQGDKIQVFIKDSGKGMPQSMVEKILNNVLIGTTKKEGHGIGLRQIRDALQSLKGSMQIESKEGAGTTFCLEFPSIAKPDWILDKLILTPENTLVILDDDSSIHQTWDLHLKAIGDKVELKYFQEGQEAIKFIQAADEKEKISFLTDYDLRKQKLNGIGVIKQIGQVGQVVIVSSNYLDPEIKDFIKLNPEIKVLPKQFISDLSIFLGKAIADIVWLDDDSMLVKIAKSRAREMGLSMDIYTKPKLLLENLKKYPKNTKFIFDHDFKDDIDGFKLAEKLHQEGFTNLCLFSGTKFLDRMIPHYLQVSYKGTVRNIDKLMCA